MLCFGLYSMCQYALLLVSVNRAPRVACVIVTLFILISSTNCLFCKSLLFVCWSWLCLFVPLEPNVCVRRSVQISSRHKTPVLSLHHLDQCLSFVFLYSIYFSFLRAGGGVQPSQDHKFNPKDVSCRTGF